MAEYRALLHVKEQCYWSSRISDSAHNPRKLWNSLKPLLQPAATEAQITADMFANFFRDKVKSIRDDTAGLAHPDVINATSCRFPGLAPVTAADISRLLGRCPSKQCSLCLLYTSPSPRD